MCEWLFYFKRELIELLPTFSIYPLLHIHKLHVVGSDFCQMDNHCHDQFESKVLLDVTNIYEIFSAHAP